MGKKTEITNDVELNLFAAGIEEKIAALELEGVKKNDIELLQKDNVDLKAMLEASKIELASVQEIVKGNFTMRSPEHKMKEIGKFLLACRTNDVVAIHAMGGRINTRPGGDDWKDDKWDVNAAPDVGTPLRGDAATGSYLVPEAFAAEILRLPEDPSALMGRVRTVPMSVRKITFPAKLAGVSFTWLSDEITAKTEKNPTFQPVTLEALTAAGWVAFTEELNEDSLVPLGEYFASLFREAWLQEFDKQLLTANAAPFTGVLHVAGTNVLTLGAGKVGFDDSGLDDIVDLLAQLDTQAKRNGAAYIIHTTVLDHFKKVKDDHGNYIYMQPAGAQPGTLWGKPYILSDVMPDMSASAAATPFMALGNPAHLLHGDRIGLEVRLFDQTMDAVVYDRLFLRCRLRQAFKAAHPAAFAVLKTAAV